MAEVVSRDVVVNVPPEKFFELLTKFEDYPKFVPSVKATKVSAGPNGARDVEYTLDLGIKKITYTLRHLEEKPVKITWSLVGGDFMKVSNGSWKLADEGGGKTRATYTVEIQIQKPPLIPQSIVDKIADQLTKVQLPKMLEAFKERAEKGA
jgi:coenzyme Q-binding protein COQ10